MSKELEGRRGTLRESHSKSSPIQTDEYLLACCRYVELNPVVRARMVAKASDYLWLSYNARMTGEGKLIPDFDLCYQALGDSAEKRSSRYLNYLNTEIPFGECAFIQNAVDREQATGNRRYIDQVEKIIGRRIEHRRPGEAQKK